ncbi:MAG: peptide-binding protein [Nitrospinae bacterium]|nr:peptide-binding protein [Nitrospinota bacterium]
MMKIIPLIFLLFIFTACQNQSGEKSNSQQSETKEIIKPKAIVEKTKMIEGGIGDASNLIPMIATDAASHSIAGLIFNGIIKFDKNLNIVGDLAENWDISEDNLTITFHLRKGVKWQDGVEFTAHDVEFGYKLITDPNTPTPYGSDFMEIKEFKVIDDYNFSVTYKEPFAPALASWGNLVVLPKHILEGQDITKTPFARNPVGLGPYKFKEWKTGSSITLEASETYFDGKPKIDVYHMRVIPDQATLFLELKSKGIDQMGLTPTQYKRQTNSEFFEKNFNKFKYIGSVYTYLGYNHEREIFKDKRVRQAITYAIDKNEIIEGVLLGLGQPAQGPYKPGTWFYNDKVKKYPYNPEKAKELLKEAGWSDTNGDGLLDKDGKDFTFTIITNQGNSLRAKTAEIIQMRLKAIGINVEIMIIEWAAFLKDFVDVGKFDAIILGWSVSGSDPDQYDIWHSSKTGPSQFNFVHYINKEIDELLVKGRKIFDHEERRKYYDRFQEILAEEQPYTFLYVPESLPIVHGRFKGIDPGPAGIAYNFDKWYVDRNFLTQ